MSAHDADDGCISVPTEPTPGLLMSMAMRYDHALGIPGYYDQIGGPGEHARRLESTLRVMRQLHEEVVGQGFYRPDSEANYVALRRQQDGSQS